MKKKKKELSWRKPLYPPFYLPFFNLKVYIALKSKYLIHWLISINATALLIFLSSAFLLLLYCRGVIDQGPRSLPSSGPPCLACGFCHLGCKIANPTHEHHVCFTNKKRWGVKAKVFDAKSGSFYLSFKKRTKTKKASQELCYVHLLVRNMQFYHLSCKGLVCLFF